jgi:hypothetical protein
MIKKCERGRKDLLVRNKNEQILIRLFSQETSVSDLTDHYSRPCLHKHNIRNVETSKKYIIDL